MDTLNATLPELRKLLSQAQSERQASESVLHHARHALGAAERQAQEKAFDKKMISSNINEISNRIHHLDEEKNNLIQRHGETETMLQAARMETLKSNLEQALTLKQQREAELATARDGLAGAEQALQEHERARLQTEQLLHPLRDRLEQARLQEQQARLLFDNCQQGLAAMARDGAVLQGGLAASTKVGELGEIGAAVQAQIAGLGPVNLGGIQERAAESGRKTDLDSQAAALEQAVA